MDTVNKKILLIGSGMCSKGVICYLMKRPENQITLATNKLGQGKELAKVNPSRITVELLDVKNSKQLFGMVVKHDIIISFVPFFLHGYVITQCVRARKNMVSASYNKDFLSYEKDIHHSHITVLGEMGMDPGIDHMSALQFIEKLRARGGKVTSYKSWCGGLPNIDSCYNPIGYKFSWSPQTALASLTRDAEFFEDGEKVATKGKDLLYEYKKIKFNQALSFDCYPNGKSCHYKEKYDLRHVKTLIRGTLRYPGYSFIMRSFCRMGLFVKRPITTFVKGETYTWRCLIMGLMDHQTWEIYGEKIEWIRETIQSSGLRIDYCKTAEEMLKCVFSHTYYRELKKEKWLELGVELIKALQWFKFFDNTITYQTGKGTVFCAVCSYFEEVLKFDKGETDVIYMQHDITAKFPDNHQETWKLNMIAMGNEEMNAMALTVGTPTAIAAQLILDGVITKKGLIDPTIKEIYGPVMKKLAKLNIRFVEVRTS